MGEAETVTIGRLQQRASGLPGVDSLVFLSPHSPFRVAKQVSKGGSCIRYCAVGYFILASLVKHREACKQCEYALMRPSRGRDFCGADSSSCPSILANY